MNRELRKINYLINKLKGIDCNGHYVIYPFGSEGERVKKILNDYFGIYESYIIDNHYTGCDTNIKKLTELSCSDIEDHIFIIASTGINTYKEIRENLFKYVNKRNTIDLFPRRSVYNSLIKKIDILKNYHKLVHFLYTIPNNSGVKLLDVGCGNESASRIKKVVGNVYYTGIDVGDYNQTPQSIGRMDEYRVVSPDDFPEEIASFENTQDIVISNHNIEHCNHPEETVIAMAKALRKGGRLFMAFPSKKSVLFPSRNGTLNFYDDESHIYLPDFKDIIRMLESSGLKIIYKNESVRNWYLRRVGEKLEKQSIAENKVYPATWDYWGFETIIWAEKKRK